MSLGPQQPTDFDPDSGTAGYHSTAEARAAVESLSDDDHAKLMIIAHYFRKHRLRGTIHEATDLLQEAILRTLRGNRCWRRGVSIVKHLDRTMESISSNPRLQDQATLTELRDAANVRDPVRMDEHLIQKEEQQTELEKIRGWFSADPPALSVLALQALEKSPSEVQEELGIGPKDYATILRRIQRTLAKQSNTQGDEP